MLTRPVHNMSFWIAVIYLLLLLISYFIDLPTTETASIELIGLSLGLFIMAWLEAILDNQKKIFKDLETIKRRGLMGINKTVEVKEEMRRGR